MIDPMTGQDDQGDFGPDGPQYKPLPKGPQLYTGGSPTFQEAGTGAPQGSPMAPAPTAPSASVGHDGTQNGLTREQYRDLWMGSGVTNNPGLDAWLQQHGGTRLNDSGLVQTPYGEQLDLLIGAKTGNGQAGWTGAPGMQGANTGPGSGVLGAPGTAPASAPGGVTDPNSFQGQIRALLLQQMQQNSKPIDANDPAIAGELQSQDNALERTRQQRHAAMAERFAAEGLNSGGQGSGAMDADLASGFEDKGTQMSAVRAQLFGRELTARRQTLNQQMQMALQTGDAESARALQYQIAQMDNQLRQLSLSQQQGQWNDQFGLQGAQFNYLKDRDTTNTALGR